MAFAVIGVSIVLMAALAKQDSRKICPVPDMSRSVMEPAFSSVIFSAFPDRFPAAIGSANTVILSFASTFGYVPATTGGHDMSRKGSIQNGSEFLSSNLL